MLHSNVMYSEHFLWVFQVQDKYKSNTIQKSCIRVFVLNENAQQAPCHTIDSNPKMTRFEFSNEIVDCLAQLTLLLAAL